MRSGPLAIASSRIIANNRNENEKGALYKHSTKIIKQCNFNRLIDLC